MSNSIIGKWKWEAPGRGFVTHEYTSAGKFTIENQTGPGFTADYLLSGNDLTITLITGMKFYWWANIVEETLYVDTRTGNGPIQYNRIS